MKKLLTILSVGYATYALLIGVFVTFLLLPVHGAQVASGKIATAIQLVPLIIVAAIAATLIVLFALLSVLLARRRARRTSLAIAAISCLGVPVGTILGGLTLYALTRPNVLSDYGEPLNLGCKRPPTIS